jgi:DNA-binding beta-propeller fold protein YncE
VVADSRNHRVQLFDENGHFLAKISDRGIYFDYPRAVTFDPTGLYVYISDFNLNHILRVDSKLQQSCTIVVDGHQLSRPQGLHIDATGQLFVSCAKADEIKVFDSWTGQPLYSLATLNDSTLDAPLNVASVNNNGHLAILEMNGKISII